MKTNNSKANLVPASRTKKKPINSRRTVKKTSSSIPTVAKKKLGNTGKVVERKIARVTRQAEVTDSSLDNRTLRRVTNVTDATVERFSRTSGRAGDQVAKGAYPALAVMGESTKRKVEMSFGTQVPSKRAISTDTLKGNAMNPFREITSRQGKIGYILAWAIGIPLPLLILVYFLRGCN